MKRTLTTVGLAALFLSAGAAVASADPLPVPVPGATTLVDGVTGLLPLPTTAPTAAPLPLPVPLPLPLTVPTAVPALPVPLPALAPPTTTATAATTRHTHAGTAGGTSARAVAGSSSAPAAVRGWGSTSGVSLSSLSVPGQAGALQNPPAVVAAPRLAAMTAAGASNSAALAPSPGQGRHGLPEIVTFLAVVSLAVAGGGHVLARRRLVSAPH